MRSVAALAAVAMVAMAACTEAPAPSADDPAAPAPAQAAGSAPAPSPVDAPPGIVRVQGCEPRSLLPADAPRACGQQVLTALFSPLVELDPTSGAPGWGDPDDGSVAASISSIEGRRWVIEIEAGWRFHDGSPVTARSFVDAWNLAASGEAGQANAFLFEPIVGFGALHCPEPGCEPAATTMDGVRALDERTLEVVLRAPDRSFPRRLAHVAFAPLPVAAVEDPAAFAEAPVGNGPFRFEAWEPERRIALRAVADHPGGPPGVDGVDLVLIDDVGDAWQALQEGHLDVATALPAGRRRQVDATFERVVRDGDVYEALVVPTHVPALSEDDRLARALSMAIDRRALIDAHLDGAARPARGLLPVVVSDEVDRCGATCRFRPAAARELLAAVGLPDRGIELWLDRSAGHEAWVRAIARQLRDHLRLDTTQVRVRSLTHTAWVAHLQDRRVDGLYPTGWSMDVPSPHEYLEELHGPAGLFNFDRYTGVDVGARLAEAAAADESRETRRIHRQLEQDLLADMHHIPLWVRTHEVVHTGRVGDVRLDGKGLLVLEDLELAEPDG